MSIHRKMKRTTKQYFIVAFISIVVMGGAAALTAIMITGQVRDKYSDLLSRAYQEMEENKRTVYIATVPIMCGDSITEENVASQTVYATQPRDIYITKEDIGKVALMDIMEGTQVLKGMLTENIISSEMRELEYTVINISSNIANDDTVDVRISYPNGENYIVLSKKIVKGYTPESATCLFWMNEEELLRMSAAIVDAELYPGSKLYVTKYIEPNTQEASVVNYIPSLSVLYLLESDPNILVKATQELSREVRKSLENRLADNLAADVTEISWDVSQSVPKEETPAPTPELTATKELGDNISTEDTINPDYSDLGSSEETADFFYYAEEKDAMEGDIEYGE